MNRKNILALAALIETVPEKKPGEDMTDRGLFDMRQPYHWCGAPACIAGWACWMASSGTDRSAPVSILGWISSNTAGSPTLQISGTWLGIGGTTKGFLFTPSSRFADWTAGPGELGWVTPQHAAAVLRNLAETGVVDWRVGKEVRA